MSGKIMAVENSQKHQHETSTSSTSAAGGPTAVHYCKVCKRRFHSAGALGGHMRSHGGAGDHADYDNTDDDVEDDYVVVKSCRTTNKAPPPHSYFLRTNTNRFVSHRGGVVKDHQDRDNNNNNNNNNKRVTTRAEYCASREEEDLANCLVMLSSNGSFVSSEDDDIKATKEIEIENNNNNNNKGLFQCKACKKVFNSHQALGGHRASHKKVKGCYAAKLDNNNLNISENNKNLNISENNLNNSESEYLGHRQDSDYSLQSPVSGISRKRSRVHQCSICHRIFSSGQALGGHKRCHWLSASGMPPEATALIQNFQEISAYDHSKSPPLIFKNPAFAAANPPSSSSSPLDLNFPPLAGDTHNPAGKSRFEQETPTRSYLKMWGNQEVISNTNTDPNHQNSRNNNVKCGDNNDEKPKMKSPKLSELKDLKLDGGSTSGWLQVGIASCHALI